LPGYNTWRNETTESQRNVRHASFRVLENLGQLQEVVDYRHYFLPQGDSPQTEAELCLRGYGSAAMIRDLMNPMPDPAPAVGQQLHRLWNGHVDNLPQLTADGRRSDAATRAERELTSAVEDTRMAIVEVLKSLE
jgi:hypothetical protein